MLEGKEIDDVHKAANIHEDSPSVESFYCEHYDQEVVIRLLHSFGVFLKEKHAPVRLSLFQGRYSVDVVHLPLTCFLEGSEQPTCGWPPCDHFYLPDHA